MSSAMLFYVARGDGSVTGPHPVGVLRRGLSSGEFSYETQVCLDGTQDWLPLTEWANEIEPPAPVAQPTINRAAVYQQLTEKPKNTPIRIFWGVIFLLMAISQAGTTIWLLGLDNLIPFFISLLFTLIWSRWGTSLMSPPKK